MTTRLFPSTDHKFNMYSDEGISVCIDTTRDIFLTPGVQVFIVEANQVQFPSVILHPNDNMTTVPSVRES